VDARLTTERFPRSSRYNPDWLIAGCSGGSNPLWLAEWLASGLNLRRGMRVLDLGCGRALSSIFLRREFEVEVWAVDLWFSASENLRRIRDAGVDDGVFPIHADARSLPFANDFFDAAISIASFPYYGTDEHYLNSLARLVRPGGQIAIAGEGLMQEIEGPVPEALADWWEPSLFCLHSAAWWQRHWQNTGIVDVKVAESMADGWQFWLKWQKVVAPENAVEIRAIEKDAGRHMGYVRVIAERRSDARLEDELRSIATEYKARPVTR